jgi:hypothetical protein
MPRTTRRTPTFDAMEGRVLLSSGLRDPAGHVHRSLARAGHFTLNGAVVGIPYGVIGKGGIIVTALPMTGQAHSMGNVNASLALAHNVIAPGQLPNLNNATLTLANAHGSVQLRMAASPSNRHVFVVASGSGAYASVYGSGTAIITYYRPLHAYRIALRSAIR